MRNSSFRILQVTIHPLGHLIGIAAADLSHTPCKPSASTRKETGQLLSRWKRNECGERIGRFECALTKALVPKDHRVVANYHSSPKLEGIVRRSLLRASREEVP